MRKKIKKDRKWRETGGQMNKEHTEKKGDTGASIRFLTSLLVLKWSLISLLSIISIILQK